MTEFQQGFVAAALFVGAVRAIFVVVTSTPEEKGETPVNSPEPGSFDAVVQEVSSAISKLETFAEEKLADSKENVMSIEDIQQINIEADRDAFRALKLADSLRHQVTVVAGFPQGVARN